MKALRRIAASSLAVALIGALGVMRAQEKWPSKPIRMTSFPVVSALTSQAPC